MLHIHTVRSDGRGTPDDIAAAAARAGLKFVVFTDHGDATRTPDPPVYRAGVLCLDGVEISTRSGHYVAIDMPASPYPLGGDARDVVDDVKRLGGFGIVAHPDSPKPELQWHAWDAPIDAIEVINPDTSWRRWWAMPGWSAKRRLLAAVVDYPFRPAETLASLLSGTTGYLAWETPIGHRRVVALAGADAHAKIAPRHADPGDNRWALPLPSYEASFRMMSVHVRTDAGLTGNAAADAALVVRALRAGHAYMAIDGVATPPAFEFSASNEQGSAREGDELGAGGPLTLRVRSDAPPSFTTIVLGPKGVLSTDHHEQDVTVRWPGVPGRYWAAIISTGRWPTLTWIVSNPISIGGAEGPTPAPVRPPATATTPIFDETMGKGWRVEHDAASQASLEVVPGPGGASLRLRYQLAAGAPRGPFVALSCDRPDGVLPDDRLMFTARAERPMRISVQLRVPDGRRWERSVYVDPVEHERTLYFADLSPVGETHTWFPRWSEVRNVLFVIDASNAKPGSSGELWIAHAALGAVTSAR